MKKAIIAILAILYMTIASGVVVNVHYCMGRVASVEVGYDDHDVCGKCGMKGAKKGCCHTEYKLIKLEDEHQLAQAKITLPGLTALVPAPAPLFPGTVVVENEHAFARQYHAPPDKRLNSVYLHNCVFRV